MMKIGIIVCSRINSARVPNKPLRKVGHPVRNMTVIDALVNRLSRSLYPVFVAVPINEAERYLRETDLPAVYSGDPENPLKRTIDCAREFGLDAVVRVCHDKIFVDWNLIDSACELFKSMNVDYLYSSKFTEGCGFEIIKLSALEAAYQKYPGRDIEHISYAIKDTTNNVHNWDVHPSYSTGFRLLIDYPDDLKLIDLIFKRFKKKTLDKDSRAIFDYLRIYPGIVSDSRPAELTIYTCVYNGAKYLAECIESVLKQNLDCKFEYIIVDDKSTDNSTAIAEEYARDNPCIKIIKNKKNVGLASSSNVALLAATGKYILRLDADDFFVSKKSVAKLLKWIKFNGNVDVVYPDNYFGEFGKIQTASECHHVGGAIFKTRAINNIKFTDNLRGYEGLDFYERAKKILNIGYYNEPVFFYRQHDESLVKNNLKVREKIKKQILARHG